MATPTEGAESLPVDPSQFGHDERISFSKLDNKFIAVVGDDGDEFEFDASRKRWVPAADGDDDPGADEYAARRDPPARRPKLTAADRFKRKWDPDADGGGGGRDAPSSKRRKVRAAPQPPAPRQNKAIYVTGLPPDATADEVAALFSRKCGVIAEEIDSGRPRVKLYADADGRFKGDALIVFFKPQSVAMALTLLDGAPFRLAASGLGSGPMRVQPADASYKKTNYDDDGAGAADDHNGGPAPNGGDAAPPPPKDRSKRATAEERAKVIRRTQKLDAKLADWSDDEDTAAARRGGSKHDKVVILRHMFTLRDLDEGPEALLEIKEDIRDECAKLGDVTNVVLYDLEDDGVVSVRFRAADAALACVRLMDGRAFDGRIVEASIATGRERYRRSGKGADEEDDEDD